jgi:hypothetical protein
MFALVLAGMLSQALHAAEPPKADDSAPVVRASKPSENGMELFSWHAQGEDNWHFALMAAPGNDKLKSVETVTSKENSVDSLAALKKRLAGLAIGEKVGWFNMLSKSETTTADIVFDIPPREIVKELELYCTVLKVRLNIYHSSKK